MKKIIFVTGSICSSVGKGVLLGTIGKLLKSMGFNIRIVKIDPYLNQDAGTMNPQEHGEVWVTADGQETDVDGGTYFRFVEDNEDSTFITTAGHILQNLFNKEREGFFQGETIRFNPHMIKEMEEIIINNSENKDFILIEIGGTIGEIELAPFLNLIKKFQNSNDYKTMHVNVSMSITLDHNKEIKIKPIELFYNSLPYGVKIDLQFVRSSSPLTDKEKQKIYNYSFLKNIINLPNFSTIYNLPQHLVNEKVPEIILDYFQITNKEPSKIDLSIFNKIDQIKKDENIKTIKAVIIGKYPRFMDNYRSINEALLHASVNFNANITVDLFDLMSDSSLLSNYDVAVVSGGFGINHTEEMMNHIRYLRQNNIPTLLICFGLQLALIDIARNLLKISDATSLEFHENGTHIICLVDEKHNPKTQNFGGTLRVGKFPIYLNKYSIVYEFYEKYNRISNQIIQEKFRHRYWINKNFRQHFEKCGVHFSFKDIQQQEDLFGFELNQDLHKYFVGVQFHPELTSTLIKPHPLFIGLIHSSLK